MGFGAVGVGNHGDEEIFEFGVFRIRGGEEGVLRKQPTRETAAVVVLIYGLVLGNRNIYA